MRGTIKVKQSDVSYGTALHWADDWSYGGNSLCGKPMRASAREWETKHKRVCGTCARIMAKRVEAAHAEALETRSAIAGTARDKLIAQGRALGLAESVLLLDTEALRARIANLTGAGIRMPDVGEVWEARREHDRPGERVRVDESGMNVYVTIMGGHPASIVGAQPGAMSATEFTRRYRYTGQA